MENLLSYYKKWIDFIKENHEKAIQKWESTKDEYWLENIKFWEDSLQEWEDMAREELVFIV